MNERSKGALIAYLYMAVQVVVNLIYVPLLLQFIGINEFGLYQLVGSVMAYLLIMNTTVAAAVQRYYNKYLALHDAEGASNVLAISRIIYRILCLAALVIGLALIALANFAYADSLSAAELHELSIMLGVLTVNVIIVLNNSIYTAAVEGHERFVFQNGLRVAITALQPLAIFIAITISPNALAVIVVQLLSVVVEVVIRRRYAATRLGLQVKLVNFDRSLARAILVFSGGILLATVADQIFWRTDQLILGYFFGTASVAVYGIATQILMCYLPLGTSVSGVFLPKATRIFRGEPEDETLSEMFVRIGRITFLLLGCVLSGFIVFGDSFIELWAGEGFHDAYLVAVIVMVPFTIDLIQNIGLTILKVHNRFGFRAKVYFAAAVANIALTIAFVQVWGIIGAALSTAIAMLASSGLVMNWYYWKRVELDIPGFWREICRIAAPLFVLFAVAAILSTTVLPAPSNWGVLLLYLIIYVLAYLGVGWAFSFNDYEKSILRSLIYTRSR